mgnify:FL=1
MNARRGSQGFSMTEALVALSVLNLLGLGFLTGQWQALRAQRDALSSQLAVAMAQDLWHRMQVHPAAWPWYQVKPTDPLPGSLDCQRQACNAMQWASADLQEWRSEWQLRWPQARAEVQTTVGALPVVSFRVSWPNNQATQASLIQPGCPDAQLCWQTEWRL